MCWRNAIATGPLLTGPAYVSSVSGEPLSGANGAPALACSGSASEEAPLTRRPEAVAPASLTVSTASPAVLMTLAVLPASYVRSTPGVNAPNVAAVPIVSASVAGTAPPAVPGAVA